MVWIRYGKTVVGTNVWKDVKGELVYLYGAYWYDDGTASLENCGVFTSDEMMHGIGQLESWQIITWLENCTCPWKYRTFAGIRFQQLPFRINGII